MEYPEFPDHSRFTPAASVLAGAGDGEVTVRGWVYRTRSSGKLAFVVIRDATGILQCTVSRAKVTEGNFDAACKALRESSVIVTGTPSADVRAPGGFELRATRFEVLHYAETFPITKDLGDEHLLDNRHLWLRSRSMVDALKVRATAFGAFRGFWDSQGYTEVQSPSFVSGACEGGSSLFDAFYPDESAKDGKAFYAHLSQSWQLYAEATMFGLERTLAQGGW